MLHSDPTAALLDSLDNAEPTADVSGSPILIQRTISQHDGFWETIALCFAAIPTKEELL
jgi:hypothetical protein